MTIFDLNDARQMVADSMAELEKHRLKKEQDPVRMEKHRIRLRDAGKALRDAERLIERQMVELSPEVEPRKQLPAMVKHRPPGSPKSG